MFNRKTSEVSRGHAYPEPVVRRGSLRDRGAHSAAGVQAGWYQSDRQREPSPPSCGSRIGIYLAARYSRAAELRGYRSDLEALGCYSVTSRWIDGDQARAPGETEAAALTRFACEDLEDIDCCKVLVAFTEEPRTILTCGGRHFEARLRPLARGADSTRRVEGKYLLPVS